MKTGDIDLTCAICGKGNCSMHRLPPLHPYPTECRIIAASPCPECARLRERVKTLEEVLKPFADAWVVYSIAARRDRRTTGVQQCIGWQPFQKAWVALAKKEMPPTGPDENGECPNCDNQPHYGKCHRKHAEKEE